MKKVVIVGGGITGLSAAYEIKKRIKEENLSIDLLLIEKEKKLGGVFLTEKVDGFLIEGGPDSFEMFKPAPFELAQELGIEDRVISANEEMHRTFIFSKGKLQEIPRGLLGLAPDKISSLMFCPLLSLRGKIRAALELIIPPLKQQGTEISLGEFYKRRFGEEIYEVVAEPLFGSIYACIPETISIKTCWPRGLELEKKYGSLLRGMLVRRREARKASKGRPKEEKKKASIFRTFKGGMSELTNTLVERIGKETFLTEKEVSKIIFSPGEKRFFLFLESGEKIPADACIVATAPSYITSKLLSQIDVGVSDMLLRIPFASSVTVSLGFKKDGFEHPLNGFGLVVARTENKRVKAVTWSSTKFAERAPEGYVLIRCFLGNAQEETIVYESDEAILNAVREDLREIMGVTVEPMIYRIYRWRNSMVQYTLGHGERIAFIEERIKQYPGLYLAGNAYRGLGVGDCINDGKRAAQKILEYLRFKL